LATFPHIAQSAWFGLLHATSPAGALLTPDVAVALVLRVRSAGWTAVPAASRKAALRLFCAAPSDLKSPEALARLCVEVPREWQLADAPAFVSAAQAARLGLAQACELCARIVAATRGPRKGGLASLQDSGAPPAGPSELAELRETARNFTGMAGFRKLLALL
jgi:hypothetical protein